MTSTTETLVRYIDRFLMFYVRTADRLQRTAPWVESLDGGLDHLREVVCDDSLGLAEEFEAAMARHVDGYACEWKGVLDDPDKLSRFVSFVNAPESSRPHCAIHAAVRPQGAHRNARPPEGLEVTLINDVHVWTVACSLRPPDPGRGVGVLLADGARPRCSGSTTAACMRWATSTRSPVQR